MILISRPHSGRQSRQLTRPLVYWMVELMSTLDFVKELSMKKRGAKMSFRGRALSLSAIVIVSISGAERAIANDLDSGIYLGVAFAIGVEQFSGVPGVSFEEGFGFDIWGGYRFNRWVAAEVELLYLKGFKIKGTGVDANLVNGTVNVKLYPLAGSIQPYLLGGVGGGRFELSGGGLDASDSGGVFRVGGGLDFYFIDSIAFVAGVDYLITRGNITDTDTVNIKLGVQYQF